MFKPQDASGILVLLPAGGLVYVALRVLYNIFLHPLRHYPGPTSWAATRLTWVVALQRGHLHQDLLRLHDQYGPVVRIAPNELSYIDAQAWKDIYISRPGHALLERNPVWFRKIPTEPWSIMGYNEDAHARFRRAFMGAFSEKAVQDQSPLLEGYVETMIQRLRAIAGKGNATMAGKSNMTLAGSDENVAVVDAVSWLNFVTFDISADLSFGESFESTSTGQPHPWVEIACRFGKGIALVASINHYGPLQSLLQRALPKKVREKMVYHRDLSAHKVRQRLQLQEERSDFVNAVLKYNREKKENEVTVEELEVNMSVIVFAGSETTSTAMAAALFHLLKTPTAMDAVTEEVRAAFSREEEISVNSSSKLEYLSAVISEAMRLGPPSAISVPRVVSGEGDEICGRWVPGGTFVGVNQYPAFRSATNFSNPQAFIPERFLKQNPEDNLGVFQPFSVGRHMCIGQKFAWAEIRLILARLLYAFDVSWGVTPSIDDWGEQRTFIFWQKEPLHIQLKPR